MDIQVTLMEFLQRGFESPACIDSANETSYNTRSLYYQAEDIDYTNQWAEFNNLSIKEQYGALLQSTKITVYNAFFSPQSPPQPVVTNELVCWRVWQHIMPRAARALRYGFKSLSMKNPSSAMKALIHDGGTAGSTPDHFASDLGFFDDSLPFETRSNRAPGVCQLSSRWSFALHSHPNPTKRREFKQLLSQVNWYMRQHHTRYGFILTDREFVAIRRLDGPGKGHLELSDPVSWEASGTVSDPRLTILLGLWYLGMLAADEENCFFE